MPRASISFIRLLTILAIALANLLGAFATDQSDTSAIVLPVNSFSRSWSSLEILDGLPPSWDSNVPFPSAAFALGSLIITLLLTSIGLNPNFP